MIKKLRLITRGFLNMLPPLESKRTQDAKAAAALERMREDQRWRAYDRPACWRFKSTRPKIAPSSSNVVQLPSIIRRQAE